MVSVTFMPLCRLWLKPLVRFIQAVIQDLKASLRICLACFPLFTTQSKSNHFTPTSSLICGREACCSCVGSVCCGERREGERERQTERKRMRGGSLINAQIRGCRFLFLVWTKIKLSLFRSSESFVAPCH